MIQATDVIGPVWDRLSREEADTLMTSWQGSMNDNPDEATQNIIHSIANHPSLKTAWNDLGDSIHQNRGLVIYAIVANTNVA